MRLTGKRIIVTGATSGLGESMVRRFIQEGARVLGTGRRQERLASLKQELGDAFAPYVVDHTQDGTAEATVAAALAAFGGLDVLVNNAGIIGNDNASTPSPEMWKRLMSTNVDALYHLICAAVPALSEGNGASILNLSSVAGLRPYPGLLGYCTSKAAVDMMTQVLAMELAPKSIRVNAMNPGVVVTELHRSSGMTPESYEAFLERGKQTHPLGRVGQPDDIASLATFLVSDEASWMTGNLVSIDGGRALTSLR